MPLVKAMILRKAVALVLPVLSPSITVLAQGKTTGRIAGTVKDPTGALIAGAHVTVTSKSTHAEQKGTSNSEGFYAVGLLQPGQYRVTVTMPGFAAAVFDPVKVVITDTTVANANLELAGVATVAVRVDPLLQLDGPQLGRVVDSRAVSDLPVAMRNFTQLLGLSPGTSVELPDNTAVGRNSQNISVTGARTNQNNYQINGVDANHAEGHSWTSARVFVEGVDEELFAILEKNSSSLLQRFLEYGEIIQEIGISSPKVDLSAFRAALRG